MVVEHVFITTLEQDDALLLADALFADLGLARSTARDGASEWSAGRDRARSLSDFRRTVRIGFDRGRITLGASAPSVHHTQEKLVAPYMLALAAALESHISHGQPVEVAGEPVRAALEAIVRRERRNRLIAYIVVGAVLLFVVGLIMAIVLITP